MTTERQVSCPACRGPSLFSPRNPWRPFCSERCRNVDLGAWASEGYRVAAPPTSEDAEDTDDNDNDNDATASGSAPQAH